MSTQRLTDRTSVTTFKRPAHGFSLAKATERELLLHGFPARPADGEIRQRYDAIARRLDRRLEWVEPSLLVLEGKGHGVSLGPSPWNNEYRELVRRSGFRPQLGIALVGLRVAGLFPMCPIQQRSRTITAAIG